MHITWNSACASLHPVSGALAERTCLGKTLSTRYSMTRKNVCIAEWVTHRPVHIFELCSRSKRNSAGYVYATESLRVLRHGLT